MTRTGGGWLAVLAVLVVAAFAASLASGSVAISPADAVRALAGRETSDPAFATIVLQLRLPKALTAALAGAALATGGLLMQTLFRNPLAGPYVLGLSAGASLGVALVVLTAGAGGARLLGELGLLGDAGLIAAASLGAGLVLVLVLIAARRVSSLTLLILGVLFGYAVSALVTVLMHFSIAERIQAYVLWTFGSFGGVTWSQLRLLAPAVLLGLGVAMACAKPANALLLGSRYARSMGLAVGRSRLLILSATALLAGSVTAFCGPIAFLGVAVPHLARALLGSGDHRRLLPAAALAGALVALVADLLAQLPGREGVLPLNAVTALLGAPVIAWLILRRRGLEGSFG
ncbi:MAG: iron ABC transporter permease [Acidobacteria bacterium]|nr:MAG: iron ABC transporter permease [Acidobacteriota bacterium]